MGNPGVWWIGFSLIILTIERIIKQKTFSAIFIIGFFFLQWLPFIFISRTTYLYHFYVNIPFLCLATAYFINKYWNKKWMKLVTIFYFTVVIILFIYFFPIISGIPQLTSYFDSVKWIESWSYY